MSKKLKFEKLSNEEMQEAKGGVKICRDSKELKAPSVHRGEKVKAHNKRDAALKAGLKDSSVQSKRARMGVTAIKEEAKLDRCWHMYGCSLC